MTAPDRETPSTSWAVWAWQAYRDGRLVEASETHTPLADAHPLASEALAVPEVAALVKAFRSLLADAEEIMNVPAECYAALQSIAAAIKPLIEKGAAE